MRATPSRRHFVSTAWLPSLRRVNSTIPIPLVPGRLPVLHWTAISVAIYIIYICATGAPDVPRCDRMGARPLSTTPSFTRAQLRLLRSPRCFHGQGDTPRPRWSIRRQGCSRIRRREDLRWGPSDDRESSVRQHLERRFRMTTTTPPPHLVTPPGQTLHRHRDDGHGPVTLRLHRGAPAISACTPIVLVIWTIGIVILRVAPGRGRPSERAPMQITA
jgi:hypothetical protein